MYTPSCGKEFSLRITFVLNFVHHHEFQKLENVTFRKLDLFPFSGEGRKTHKLLSPLERVTIKSVPIGSRSGQNEPTVHTSSVGEPIGDKYTISSLALKWAVFIGPREDKGEIARV
jgi:hypothetical protein